MDEHLILWTHAETEKLYEAKRNANPRAIGPVGAEIFASRILRELNIGAPREVIPVSSYAASTLDPTGWIFKSWDGTRLKSVSVSEPLLAIRKIPGAVSLVFLRERYEIASRRSRWNFARLPIAGDSQVKLENLMRAGDGLTVDAEADRMRELLEFGKLKQTPPGFFGDFVEPVHWDDIRAAVQWDSVDRLRIHAARLFLGTTAAHAGNILVDRDGRLYSVDHEFCACLDGAEIAEAAKHVKPNTKARRALERVSRLTETAIDRALRGISADQFVLGSRERTADYFKNRLELFRRHFGSG